MHSSQPHVNALGLAGHHSTKVIDIISEKVYDTTLHSVASQVSRPQKEKNMTEDAQNSYLTYISSNILR
eukprot:1157822-Pelagomonas_calceolata.AAC.30